MSLITFDEYSDLIKKENINKIVNNKREGFWKLYSFHHISIKALYFLNEKGKFKDGEKNGYWKKYNKNGDLINKFYYI